MYLALSVGAIGPHYAAEFAGRERIVGYPEVKQFPILVVKRRYRRSGFLAPPGGGTFPESPHIIPQLQESVVCVE